MKSKLLLPVVLAALVVVTIYALTKPQRSGVPAPQAGVAPVPAASLSAPANPPQPTPLVGRIEVLYAQPNVFDVVIQNGRRLSEPAVLRVHEGDEVTLRITSDTADEFHLHGYDVQVAVTPERTAILKLKAKRTGRFTYELHKSGLELGALEVYPR